MKKGTATIRGKRKRRARVTRPSSTQALYDKCGYRFADLKALGLGGRAFLYSRSRLADCEPQFRAPHVFLLPDIEKFLATLPKLKPRNTIAPE